jgi:hypothetical protein
MWEIEARDLAARLVFKATLHTDNRYMARRICRVLSYMYADVRLHHNGIDKNEWEGRS